MGGIIVAVVIWLILHAVRLLLADVVGGMRIILSSARWFIMAVVLFYLYHFYVAPSHPHLVWLLLGLFMLWDLLVWLASLA